MRLRNFYTLSLAGLMALSLHACKENKDTTKKDTSDTVTSGNINIALDETLKPVLEQQLKVFDSSYPDAVINANYKPQELAFMDLMNDSVRMVVASRDLSDQEKAYYKTNNIYVRSLEIAKDGVAVIINNAAQDSLMDMDILRNIITNQFARSYNVVFDNDKSSIVRYMIDSILDGKPLPEKVYAVNNTDSVIQYVKQNKNAIGFVGVSHLYDPKDSTNVGHFINDVRVVAMKDDSTNSFNKPYQAYIALGQYPLSRTIYFHLRESHRGLGTGFANFIAQDRGQLIFRTSKLVPLRVPLIIRDAVIKE